MRPEWLHRWTPAPRRGAHGRGGAHGRRAFLERAALGAAGLAVLGCGSNDTPGLVEPAIIIGSGFGGSVAALRLAEAGIPAIVLERGRRWQLGEFTSLRNADHRAAWFADTTPIGLSVPTRRRYAGLVEKLAGDNIDVMLPAGVGAGSIVYAGMMVQPPRDLFASLFPSDVSYDDMLARWFPKVTELLPLRTIPADLLASETYRGTRLFIQHAEAAGLPWEHNLAAIDWDLVRAELDGDLPEEAIVGDYIYGLNSGAKGQLDRTYLARAEATGLVEVRPLHQVTSIAADAMGGYRVEVEHIEEDGNVLERMTLRAPLLFVAAGSVHSTRLLVEARARGELPMLSPEVGAGWGHNGQHIHMRNELGVAVGPYQGGPPNTVIRDLENPVAPITVEHAAAAFGYDCGCMILPSSSLNSGTGSIEWDGSRAVLRWDPNNAQLGIEAAENVANRLNAASGGVLGPLIGRTRQSTFHPLGGVVMGRATDSFGRVHGYRGLYVIDGALMPACTPTANPAWTIAAIAERSIDTIIREDLG